MLGNENETEQIVIARRRAKKYRELVRHETLSMKLSSDFGRLLKSGNGADVTFLVVRENSQDLHKIKAHKFILSQRSPVFRKLFLRDQGANELTEVVVDDIRPRVLYMILRYMYTGEVDKEWVNRFATVVFAADKYGLVELLNYFDNNQEALKFTRSNVSSILVLAEMHKLKKIEVAACNFLKDYIQQLVNLEQSRFKEFSDDSSLDDGMVIVSAEESSSSDPTQGDDKSSKSSSWSAASLLNSFSWSTATLCLIILYLSFLFFSP